jgi:lysophospholipase L1-like esterase
MRLAQPVNSGLRCFLLAAAILALWRGAPAGETPRPKENRWESKIRQFEAQDKKQTPPPGGILFVGSSSIVGWKLEEYFPDLPVINRGFGGSQIADSVHFAGRIILPYRPRIIVLYAGDNDVAAGKSAQRVLADYQQFVKTVHHALPHTRIVFIAIKPSLRRWQLVDTMRGANELIRAVTREDDRLAYVDIDTPMIGADGKPRKELFKADGLHLNAEGYQLWTSLVLPHLTLGEQQQGPAEE